MTAFDPGDPRGGGCAGVTWTEVEPLVDEPAQHEYWYEPWTPKIGDRVRVRLSGECPARGPTVQNLGDPIVEGAAHPDHQRDIAGRITRCLKPVCGYVSIGHSFVVQYIHDGKLRQGHFAACELEPVASPPRTAEPSPAVVSPAPPETQTLSGGVRVEEEG